MKLETNRLVLTSWEAADWKAFRPIATDPEVMRYITGGVPWTDAQIQTFVECQTILYSQRGFCRWKLISKSNAELIGFCGVGLWHDAPEIGWWLSRPHWGRGLATEAAETSLRDIFERVGLDQIISIARPANAASIRIMEKLGLTRECELENDGVHLLRYVIDRSRYAALSRSATQSSDPLAMR